MVVLYVGEAVEGEDREAVGEAVAREDAWEEDAGEDRLRAWVVDKGQGHKEETHRKETHKDKDPLTTPFDKNRCTWTSLTSSIQK